MKRPFLSFAASAALLLGSSAAGFAQTSGTPNTPGDEMQQPGSTSSRPGASADAPGREMQQNGNAPANRGASRLTPGRSTTGQDNDTGPSRDRMAPSRGNRMDRDDDD